MFRKIWEFIVGFIGLFSGKTTVIDTDPVVMETWVESTGSGVYLVNKYSDGTIKKEPWNADDDDPTDVGGFLDSVNK